MKKYFVFIALSFLLASVFVLGTAWVTIEHPELNVAFEKPTFNQFMKLFPKEELPFSLSRDEVKTLLIAPKQGYKAQISREYFPFLHGVELPSMFSRMPESLAPVFAFENSDFQGLVVQRSMGFSNYSNYTLLMYKPNGEYWGTHDFGSLSPGEVRIPSLDNDFLLELKPYTVEWSEYDSDNRRTVAGLEELATVDVDCTVPNPKEVRQLEEFKPIKFKTSSEDIKERVQP